ncbi:MAG: hypothetical protein E6J91_42775 [Deltaproteobacteria bacterium]|nr:MAG: hypothetical protein E6J91_42775 [Deltaproteobacteria bacterium]
MAKIFVGSSSQMIPLVAEITKCLRARGHAVRPWKEIFETGDITIDRLLTLAREVDGAILVFSKDDKIEQDGDIRYQARGNVLIEYGLFGGLLGRKKTIICSHGNNRMPSDLSGLSYLNVGSSAEALSPQAHDRLIAWAADLIGENGGSLDEPEVCPVFASFPMPEFRQAVHQAKRLHILQTFIPYTQHLHLFEPDLMDAIERGCEVQVLLSSPWSTVVELRQQALSLAYGRNIVRDQVRINLEHFAARARALPADQRGLLEVRVHTAMPSMSIYRVDDLFFAGHYFQGHLAIDSPHLRVSNPRSSMGWRLAREHLEIWRASTTVQVDFMNIEDWLRAGPPR